MPSGFDPMGGDRFSEKDMRQQKKVEHHPDSIKSGCAQANGAAPIMR
jgi:hypothetical protein